MEAKEARLIRRTLAAAALGSGLFVVAPALPCAAAEGTASVHVAGRGAPISMCVEVTDGMTGIDMLRATGLDLVTEEFAGAGSMVCSIDGEGRDYPRQSCAPPCPSGRCRFWAYLTRDVPSGEWIFSEVGASSREVSAGDADAWVLGEHAVGLATPPRGIDLDVCARGVSAAASASPSRAYVGLAGFALAGVLGAAALRRMRRPA